MGETCNGMERYFPIPEDFQIRMNDILFMMKYHGKYTFDEVMSLPVMFRDRQIELLIKQLKRESGDKGATETMNPELNAAQEKTLEKQDYKKLAEEAWMRMMLSAGGDGPLGPQKAPDANLERVLRKPESKPKMKSPF